MSDDQRFVRGTRSLNEDFTACWHASSLYVNAGADGSPCLGASYQTAKLRSAVILHFSLLKRSAVWRNLRPPPWQVDALHRTDEFTVTRDGIWLPIHEGRRSAAPAASTVNAVQRVSHVLLSGRHPSVMLLASTQTLRQHVAQLAARAAATLCTSGKRMDCPAAAPILDVTPCSLECKNTSGSTTRDIVTCQRSTARLRARMCPS